MFKNVLIIFVAAIVVFWIVSTALFFAQMKHSGEPLAGKIVSVTGEGFTISGARERKSIIQVTDETKIFLGRNSRSTFEEFEVGMMVHIFAKRTGGHFFTAYNVRVIRNP